MLYHPLTKISYGIHKGFEIFKIYQYDPFYLEWLIEFTADFSINLDEFNNLPKPTPFENKVFKLIDVNNFEKGYEIESIIPKAEEYLRNGNKLKEIDFQFSENAKRILNKKKEENYIVPEYQFKKINKTDILGIDELFD